MNTQPEALRLADALECRTGHIGGPTMQKAAAELRRLHALNHELLEALVDISHGLEGARIWGGMDWTYNPLHPFKYLPLRDKARALIDKAKGQA